MKSILAGIAAVAMASAAHGGLVLTGVIDGPRTGGTPKAVEIYVDAAVADLSQYGVSSANNGGAVPALPEFVFPAVAGTAGSYLYLATEAPNFTAYFGFAPDYTNANATNVNGDDVMVIQKFNGVTWDVVDAFGTVGTQPAADTTWNHADSWFYRNDGTGPNATFNLSDWFFPPGQSDALDPLGTSGVNPASPDPLRFPVGTYVPEPAALSLLGLGAIGLIRRRRQA